MSDDLVKELRSEALIADEDWTGIYQISPNLAFAAADRIEKLVAALKHCINALKQYEMGDDRPRGPAGPVRPWLLGAMDNAIETLEGK